MKIMWPVGGKDDSEDPRQQKEVVSARAQGKAERQQNSGNWVDDLIERHVREGGFDNLPGKGKPLPETTDAGFDATFGRMLKNANVLPEWVEMQKQIASDLVKLVEQSKKAPVDVSDVNAKIRKYNAACPSPLLQRPLVSADNLEAACERWRS